MADYSCTSCTLIPSFNEQGDLLFFSDEITIIDCLKTRFTVTFDERTKEVSLSYRSKEEAKEIVTQIEEVLFTGTDRPSLFGAWRDREENQVSSWVLFPKFKKRIQEHIYLEIITDGLFTHHLQPIFSLHTDRVFGYEFLLRPLEGVLHFHPGKLFGMSQETGLQSLLDSQARRSSIRAGADRLARGEKRFINFLPSSIYDPHHCLETTFREVERSGVDPEDLVFEVVETEDIKDTDHLKEIFNVYRNHGIQVALDDIGSGYSTLERMEELCPDYGKVDRGLIHNCFADEEKKKKLEAIREKGEQLGIELLAEGIEKKEEADFVKSLGFHYVQGYYLGKPNYYPLPNKTTKSF
ncbi:EAL domain-containing protein [Thalassorhabdus alkalitolerans]|uniref:EAL domain-containing protein n=1 Tax=Thalassorhabdus alkalitolerans TaxID=2282697 RepID=A0ABW0YMC7_9BACI